MLVTLLVVWLAVIPALTILGTYLTSGFVARRAAAGRVLRAPGRDDVAPRFRRHAIARSRGHSGGSGDHAFVGR